MEEMRRGNIVSQSPHSGIVAANHSSMASRPIGREDAMDIFNWVLTPPYKLHYNMRGAVLALPGSYLHELDCSRVPMFSTYIKLAHTETIMSSKRLKFPSHVAPLL